MVSPMRLVPVDQELTNHQIGAALGEIDGSCIEVGSLMQCL